MQITVPDILHCACLLQPALGLKNGGWKPDSLVQFSGHLLVFQEYRSVLLFASPSSLPGGMSVAVVRLGR